MDDVNLTDCKRCGGETEDMCHASYCDRYPTCKGCPMEKYLLCDECREEEDFADARAEDMADNYYRDK